ncbi:hypothetical protein C1645_758575 [Glomus cerebriforme]|uniref:Transmembrane protein 198 n=1 Tax=Glomus cerebriforme TaxID=658196 RepID=A0A397TDG8_9GLOM|nr:hypothetical protein C1645_758575 [Glomus cerebriforme]
MKFYYYYFTTILIFLLLPSSVVLSANSNKHHKHQKFTNHMTSTPVSISTIQTAVLLPTTSTISSISPISTTDTTNIRTEDYASPSYNISYGEPAPILQTRNTWHEIIYGILFMIVGLIEVFYGYKFIRITLLIMGFLFWSSTSVIILLMIDNSNETFRSALYYFALWLGVGILGGLLSYWCWHLGLILSSAYGGFAFIITILTLSQISIDILRYILIAFFVLLPSIVVHKYERHSINVATSIAGSYTFFYGIDEFAHQGYKEMIQLTRFEGTFRFKPTVSIYVMIVFTVLLAAFGIIFEHICHETPCYNSWCGDKHRRDVKNSEGENTCTSVTDHYYHQLQQIENFIISSFSSFSQKSLRIIKINLLKLLSFFQTLFNFIWNYLRDFVNLLLFKTINLFKIVNLELSSLFNKKNNQVVNGTDDMHVINIDNQIVGV